MLCSHNSMTFVRAKNPVFNLLLFKRLWKTQERGLTWQMKHGVKCFDLHLRCRPKGTGMFVFCSGLVDLDSYFSVHETVRFIERNNCFFRIVLERGKLCDNDRETLLNTFTRREACMSITERRTGKTVYANPAFAAQSIEDLTVRPSFFRSRKKDARMRNREWTERDIDNIRTLVVSEFVDLNNGLSHDYKKK